MIGQAKKGIDPMETNDYEGLRGFAELLRERGGRSEILMKERREGELAFPHHYATSTFP